MLLDELAFCRRTDSDIDLGPDAPSQHKRGLTKRTARGMDEDSIAFLQLGMRIDRQISRTVRNG